MGALGRAGGVVAVGVVGRALVEGERDVGAERRLHLHRLLRPEEALGSVEVGAEADALLGDLEHRALAAGGPRRPLISSATLPWASEKTWKPPESVMIAPLPAHEPVQPAERRDPLRPGRSIRWKVLPRTIS